MPTLWPATPRPPALPTGRALVRRASGDMAGSSRTACPLARPYGDTSVSDDARRARSGAPGQQSDQQSAQEPARALSTLPHAARSAAPFGAALDHLPPALGGRRSLPRPVPGNGRRAAVTLTFPRPSLNRLRESYSLEDFSHQNVRLSRRPSVP